MQRSRRPPICVYAANGTNGTTAGPLDNGNFAYLAGLTPFAKAQVIASLALACLGTGLYAVRIGTMVHRRLPYSYVTLASALTAMFPVYEALLCLAVLVPKSAEFMHVLMAAYAMIVFNDLANLLAFKFGAIRFILGRRCGGGDSCRVAVIRSKPLWSRFRLLATRALIRQGKLLLSLNVALSAALQLSGEGGEGGCEALPPPLPPLPPPPLGLSGPRLWLRALAFASRLVASAAAVALVARCCRAGGAPGGGSGSSGFLLPGYQLGAKFCALAFLNAAHIALEVTTCAAFWAGIGITDEMEFHAQFALLLLSAAGQVWSLTQFGWWAPAQALSASSALGSSAAGGSGPKSLLQQPPPPTPPPLSELSPTSAIVDDSVPEAARGGGGVGGQCASCNRLALLLSARSRDHLSSTRLLAEY